MAKEKKNRTPTEQKRYYKRLQWGLFAGEYVSLIAPFLTIGIVNFQEYFIEYDGVKMSLAAVISFAVMGLAVWLVSKEKFENSFIAFIVGWAIVDGIFWLMGTVINDIAKIMLFGLIGLLGAYGLDIGSKRMKKKANKIQEGIDQAKKESIAKQYHEEVEQKETKKIKVKIKK